MDVKSVVESLKHLSLEFRQTDPVFEQTREGITSQDVAGWFTIESNLYVRLEMIDYALNSSDRTGEQIKEISSDNDDEDDDVESTLQALPPTPTIMGLFQELGTLVYNCQVDGAMAHLKRGRKAFLERKCQEGALDQRDDEQGVKVD